MNWRIPLFDTDFGRMELDAVQEAIRSGWITMGPLTERVEGELCARTGAKHAIAVSSCTAALHLSLLAAGIKEGDEVLCPGLTFVATANAVRYVGATPILCESVSERNLNIDPDDAEAKFTDRTRCLLVVHYAGYPADMASLADLARRHNLVLVEDCAHACFSAINGRCCGTWGAAGCFSFFSNKNITCAEGGAVITNSDDIARSVRLLRSHGMTSLTLDRHKGRATSYDVVALGYNYRMDEIRAGLLLSQLSRVDAFLAARQRVAAEYHNRLRDARVTVPDFDWERLSSEGDYVGNHIMPVLLPRPEVRLAVMTSLKDLGIQTSIHYPIISSFSSYAGWPQLGRTAEYAARQLTLPLFPTMTNEQVTAVCDALLAALN